MVCKKSLYCLKYGPCANYQIRKQIWEENIRFRESLRNINQSDHYWSFQITNNEYSDLDEPSFHKKKNRGYKYRNCYDCVSVTHEYTPEGCDALKTCLCSKKNGNLNNYTKANGVDMKNDSPETKALFVRPSKEVQTQPMTNQRLNSCSVYSKPNKNVTEYCHRYRNSLSSAQITPSTKIKFSSQSTLIQPKRNVSLKWFPSVEALTRDKSYLSAVQKDNNDAVSNAGEEKDKIDKKQKELSCIKMKNDLVRNKETKLPSWLSGTPISRTTRKMLQKNKQIPFTSFGCNNSNDLVGSKKTHNVYASTKEIYPNALSAKQQREEMIMKSLKKEKLFRNSLLQDGGSRKTINHSSLWAPQGNAEPKKERYALLQKKSQKIAY